LKTASIFGGFVFVLLIILFPYMYLAETKIIKSAFREQGRFLAQTYSPILIRALEINDDLTLINKVMAIFEQPDVIYAMVLNPDGSVRAHNKPTEFGKIYEDNHSRAAADAETLTIFTFHYRDNKKLKVYEFVAPLMSKGQKSGTLRFAVVSKIVKEKTGKRFEFYLMAFMLILVTSVIGAYFYGLSLSAPLIQANESLEDMKKEGGFPELIEIPRKDEIGLVINSIYKIAQKMKEKNKDQLEELELHRKRFRKYIEAVGSALPVGAIFMDSNNKIMFINETAAEIIFADVSNSVGKHILEVSKNTEFAQMFKQALKQPNEILKCKFKNSPRDVSIVSILGPEKMPIGMAIIAS